MRFLKLHKYFIAILILGSILRLADLSGESIWVDEGRSMALAKMSVENIIDENAQDNHPPIYYLFLHFWIKIFGTGEYSGRLPAALLGIGSIAMIYFICRKFFDQDTSLYATLFFSLSVFHIQYSQEIKTYAPATFLTLLSFFAFLNLLKDRHLIQILLYLVSSVFLLYTHFLAIPVILAQNIIFFARYARSENNHSLRSWILIQLTILVLFSPWVPFLFQRTADLPGSFWLPPITLMEIPKTFLIYAGTYTPFGIAILIIFTILIIIAIRTRQIPGDTYLLLLSWLCVPIALPLLISFLYAPIYIIRITIVASIPFYILAGYGLAQISNRFVRSQILLYILLLSCANLITYYTESHKERWRETVEILEKSAEPEDLILVHAGFCVENAIDFYRQRQDLTIRSFPAQHLKIMPVDTADLAKEIQVYNRIWLIRSHSRDSTDMIPATLSRNFKAERLFILNSLSFNSHKPYTGVELSRWLKKSMKNKPIAPEVNY